MVGIVYRKWVTTIAGSDKFNAKTGLGPWSDHVEFLAYALTPLTIGLSMRENLLSLVTGIPYQNFNFLHRWVGRVIYIQSALHTMGWPIVEAKLYQPQPKPEGIQGFMAEIYIIFGVFAMLFITIIFAFNLPPIIRLTGYEVFRKVHYLTASLYIRACWGHWPKLACSMIPSLALFDLDRGIRLFRTMLIHFGKKDPSKGQCYVPKDSSKVLSTY